MAGPVPIQARQQPHAGSSAHPHASLTPSTLSTSLMSSSQHSPYPSTPSSGAGRTLLSPLQRPAPTPIPFSTSGPRANQGMGSYGTSLAKSLRMGSYGGMGSFEDRMRMGSWKGKYVGNDAGPAWFGGVDSHDFSSMAMSTSVESIGGSMKMARNEAEYCQNYNCCGLELSSMHDLLEHYEDVHVIILPSPQSTPQGGSSHDVDSMELDSEPASSSSSSGSTNSNPNSPPLKRRQPIPASAPLQLSDVLAPPTNAAFETSVFSTSAGRKKTKQALAGRAAFTNPGDAGTDGQNGQQAQQTPGASTVWEGEYKFGTGTPPPSVLPVVTKNQSIPAPTPASCIPPKLLFPSSSNPPASANDAAAAVLAAHQGAIASAALLAGPNGQATIQTLALAHPNGIPPPSSGQKIFKCPTPGCQKSYKQQNGLKYHLKVGQCNFEVRDAVENGLSEAEAEEKSRPFVCQVGGGCTKRYRQMNGLRYHYLNSGAHGAIGLAMVAQGKHGHPKLPGGAYAPGGQGNGFTSTTAMGQLAAANAAAALAAAAQQTPASQPTSIVNGSAPATAQQLTAQQTADLIARQAAQAQQQHTQPGPWEQAAPKSDEVLFTVVENDDDVDMDME